MRANTLGEVSRRDRVLDDLNAVLIVGFEEVEERVAGQPKRLGDKGQQAVTQLLTLQDVVFKGLVKARKESLLWPLHRTVVFSYSPCAQ